MHSTIIEEQHLTQNNDQYVLSNSLVSESMSNKDNHFWFITSDECSISHSRKILLFLTGSSRSHCNYPTHSSEKVKKIPMFSQYKFVSSHFFLGKLEI